MLLTKAVDFLLTNLDGLYVDATLGGGDHTQEILRRGGVRVIAIDRDIDAIEVASKRFPDNDNLQIVHGAFADVDDILDSLGEYDADGFLFDLGLSSHQINTGSRGFSFDNPGPLDMRADARYGTGEGTRSGTLTASSVLNHYTQDELYRVFSEYGQLSGSSRLARVIVESRPFTLTSELRAVSLKVFGSRKIASTLSKVFQAIRIEVNDEMHQLKQGLQKAHDLLIPGGRLVVISYHSLEDRIVKRFFKEAAKKCVCPPGMPICRCGKEQTLRLVTRKPIKPSDEEIKDNSRARSATMRVGEKL